MRRYILIAAVFVLFHAVPAQPQVPERDMQADSVTVSAAPVTSFLKGTAADGMRWEAASFDAMPHMLGSANPLRIAQSLPHISTSSVTDAGVHIQGTDNQHNAVLMDGVTIYNPAHLFGFFSVLNTAHFDEMVIRTSAASASHAERLGGTLEMQGMGRGGMVPEAAHGQLSAGLVSSEGSLRMPLGKRTALAVAGRTSYINTLYSKWLEYNGEKLHYNFDDWNATLLFAASARDRLWADFYTGGDGLRMDDPDEETLNLSWYNTAAGLHHLHLTEGGGELEQTVFFTHYRSRLLAGYINTQLRMPAHVDDAGYSAVWRQGALQAAFRYTHHAFLPQRPETVAQGSIRRSSVDETQSHETSAAADWTLRGVSWQFTAGMQLKWYRSDDDFFAADPVVTLKHNDRTGGLWTLQGAVQHQFLHNAGFSAVGLPTECWFSAGKAFRPQRAGRLSLTWNHSLTRTIALEAGTFGALMAHQTEYTGNLYDLFSDSDYSLEESVRDAKGYNWGLTLMVHRHTGALTGWVSYAFTKAQRKFSEGGDWFPSSHERPHEWNVVLRWQPGGRWELGATGVYASGTPFTAPSYFYLLNQRILSEYGPYNGNRLPAYRHADITVNYRFKSRNPNVQRWLNLTVNNAFKSRNALYYRLKFYNGNYGYRPMRMYLSHPLPSISYHVKF